MIFLIEFKPTTNVYPSYMPVKADTRIEAWDKAVALYGASVKDVHYKNAISSGEFIKFGTEVIYTPTNNGVESNSEPLTFPLK